MKAPATQAAKKKTVTAPPPTREGKSTAKPASSAAKKTAVVAKAVKPTSVSSPIPAKKAAKTAVAQKSPPSQTSVASVPAAAPSRASKAKVPAVAAPAAATVSPAKAKQPVVVEPTVRPLGKRAAKKVMMEQMTQAAVVPTHSPDAAKATFSSKIERVMTSPVPSSIQKDPKRANNWKSLPIESLTDQDIQAMPDSEYMNDLQQAFFRRKLSLLKADMLANAGETTEHLREDTVVVPDPADRATIEEEHALELRTRDRERKLLKKIEQAIARIDAGDYGYCEETGEAIGVARLMARPTASLSLEAQQRRELKQKMFGD